MDTDSFVVIINNSKVIEGLYNRINVILFSNLNKDHELFSKESEKLVSKFKIEALKIFWIDEFIYLRSKVYSLKCGSGNKNELKIFLNPNRKKLLLKSIPIVYSEENL